MGFTLYPDPPVRALSVPAGEVVFTPFVARSGRVAELDPPYAQVMFLRVAMLGGSAVPGLLVAAGAGAPVEVSVDPQGVFRSPGGVGYVGDVWLKTLGTNVFEVVVGLVSGEPGLVWRLGTRNTDVVDRHFTWVVADSEADTAQSWVDPGPVDYRVTATVPVGAEPRDIAVDPDTRQVYVTFKPSGPSNGNNPGLAIIDPNTPPPARAVVAGKNPLGVAVDPASHDIYVTDSYISPLDDNTNTVLVLDAATLTQKGSVVVGPFRSPRWLAVDDSAQLLYVANLNNTVSVIDTATKTLVGAIDARGSWGLAYDPAAHLLYASGINHDRLGTLTVIDTRTRQILAVVVVDNTPRDVLGNVVLDPQTSSLYVADHPGGTVWRIDMLARTVRDSIRVGKEPIGMAVDRATHTIYVANSGDNTLSVIDTRSRTVRDVVAVGEQPFGVAVDPTTHTAYAANMRGSTVSVIQPQR